MTVKAVRSLPWPRLLSVEIGALAQKATGVSSEFVGRRDGRFVSRHTGDRLCQPRAETEGGSSVWAHHDHVRRLHEQHPQKAAAAFGDPAGWLAGATWAVACMLAARILSRKDMSSPMHPRNSPQVRAQGRFPELRKPHSVGFQNCSTNRLTANPRRIAKPAIRPFPSHYGLDGGKHREEFCAKP